MLFIDFPPKCKTQCERKQTVLTRAKNIYTNFTAVCNTIFHEMPTPHVTKQIFEVKPELFSEFLSKAGQSPNTHVFKL